MSVASVGLRKTRIIAIPLTRSLLANSSSPKGLESRVLTYYQFQLSSKKKHKHGGGISNWIQNKAAETWTSFGKADGGWKLKVFQWGERLVDRMDFEELALKSIDPSMGPTVTHPSSNTVMEEKAGGSGRFTIPLLYPSSITAGHSALSQLRQDVDHRAPVHRRGFWMWLIIAPFTAPFMIIPLIPNLPFFFCVWRSWSHYRAYRSSQYLQSLLEKDLIVPEASDALDLIYKEYHPSQTVSPETTPRNPKHERELLLSKDALPVIVDEFDLEPSITADLHRALEQARVRVESGKVGP